MKKQILATTILAVGLLSAAPVYAEQPLGFPKPGLIAIADLKESYAEAATKAVKAYADGKVFTLEEAYKNKYNVDEKTEKEVWIVQSKDSDAVVTIDMDSGKVKNVSLHFAPDEITGKYATHEKKVQAFVKEQQLPEFSLKEMKFVKYEDGPRKGEETLRFAGEKGLQFIIINVKTGKIEDYFGLIYKLEKVDNKLKQSAEQALSKLMDRKVQPFTDVEREMTKGEERYVFKRMEDMKNAKGREGKPVKQATQNVLVNSKGKVLRASFISEPEGKERKKISPKEAVAAAAPVIKTILGVDVGTHNVEFDSDISILSFTSKGKDKIVADFDRFGTLTMVGYDFSTIW